MFISKFKVYNFKSILGTDDLTLTQGFNVITGQNNAGKTALLEALSLTFQPLPHRSVKTMPTRVVQTDPQVWVETTVVTTGEELREILVRPGNTFNISLPKQGTAFTQAIGMVDDSPTSLQRLRDHIFGLPKLELSSRLRKPDDNWILPHIPAS